MPRLRHAIDLDPQPAMRAALRRCDHPDCGEAGEHRAPRDRGLRDYYWFCLEHVRAYNAAWDYFRGMNATEIEACRRADVVGGRPSWPMGSRRASDRIGPEEIREALRRAFGEDEEPEERSWTGAAGRGAGRRVPPRARGPEEEALAVLELESPVSFGEIRARYLELVKLHHPDRNGGDKASEDRLKSINQAYMILKVQAAKAGW